MPRITRISGSLAAVLVAYWAYALMAVPLIDPPAPPLPPGGNPIHESDIDIGKLQIDAIRPLFPANAWQLDPEKTKVLESEHAKLLFQTYDTSQGGGKVVLTPCTIIYLSEDAEATEAQRLRESIILEAPRAVLHFDRDLGLKPSEGANLLDGQLDGEIVIRSDWKQPGPEDDLLIITKNVQLNKQSISTPERVRFNWGPHFGSGQDMEIKLLPGNSGASGLDVAGIASFELRHIERLHLELGPEGQKLMAAPSKTGVNGDAGQSANSASRPKTPVDIACSGPFRFDVARRVATFHDNVRVVKTNPRPEKGTGPICAQHPPGRSGKLDLSPFPAPDQIACDLLSLWFIERASGAGGSPSAKTATTAGSLDLAPERLEAVGNPVVVTAPSSNATAQAKRIEYNLLAKSITLDGDDPVFLQQGPNQICARSLYYESAAEEGRLGQLVAQGPGWLRGRSPERPNQQLEAVWREQLRIQPRDQYKEISFSGGVELKSPGVGQLQAQRVFFWLTETPSPSGGKKFDLQPHGLTASEEVCFGSSQISGRVDELEVWFEKDAGGQGPGASDERLAAASSRRPAGIGGSPLIGPLGGASSNGSEVQRLPPTVQQHFEVSGRRLRARVLYGQADPALTDLTIEDNVQLLETQTSQPGKQPVLIRGNRLDLIKANGPDALATVVGQPAHFEGDGLGLTGATIKVNSGTNHLTIDGPGQMDIAITKDLDDHPLPAPCNLAVVWQQGMDFDGRTAHFEQSVVASSPALPTKSGTADFRLKTSSMDVQMQHPIRFSDAKSTSKPEVEEIRCRGGVEVDSHSFDAQRQLASHDQMQTTDVAVNLNRLGGGLTGGRGWINSVQYGSDDMRPGQPNAATNNAPAKPKQLYCLHVKFERDVTGNVFFRQVTFRDHVRASFAPVDSWDAMLTTNEDPSRLGPQGAVANCDELQVFQPLLPFGGDHRAIELYMLGNAVVEGAEYKALGSKILYAQAKEVLTVEGSGLALAELFQQKRAGAPAKRVTAQKIRYFLKSKDVEVDGVQMLEVPLPGGKK
ncbi:MAG: hypothetical protein WBL72_07650 [Thermoguttaceae bacterium]